MASRTKKPVSEKMAIAEAKLAGDRLLGLGHMSCRMQIESAVEAGKWLGRAEARLSQDHPDMIESRKTFMKRLDGVLNRCGGGK